MKIKTDSEKTQYNLIQKGYKILQQKMGATDALRFVMSFYSGGGDSVKDKEKIWKNKSIDEIAKIVRK